MTGFIRHFFPCSSCDDYIRGESIQKHCVPQVSFSLGAEAKRTPLVFKMFNIVKERNDLDFFFLKISFPNFLTDILLREDEKIDLAIAWKHNCS